MYFNIYRNGVSSYNFIINKVKGAPPPIREICKYLGVSRLSLNVSEEQLYTAVAEVTGAMYYGGHGSGGTNMGMNTGINTNMNMGMNMSMGITGDPAGVYADPSYDAQVGIFRSRGPSDAEAYRCRGVSLPADPEEFRPNRGPLALNKAATPLNQPDPISVWSDLRPTEFPGIVKAILAVRALPGECTVTDLQSICSRYGVEINTFLRILALIQTSFGKARVDQCASADVLLLFLETNYRRSMEDNLGVIPGIGAGVGAGVGVGIGAGVGVGIDAGVGAGGISGVGIGVGGISGVDTSGSGSGSGPQLCGNYPGGVVPEPAPQTQVPAQEVGMLRSLNQSLLKRHIPGSAVGVGGNANANTSVSVGQGAFPSQQTAHTQGTRAGFLPNPNAPPPPSDMAVQPQPVSVPLPLSSLAQTPTPLQQVPHSLALPLPHGNVITETALAHPPVLSQLPVQASHDGTYITANQHLLQSSTGVSVSVTSAGAGALATPLPLPLVTTGGSSHINPNLPNPNPMLQNSLADLLTQPSQAVLGSNDASSPLGVSISVLAASGAVTQQQQPQPQQQQPQQQQQQPQQQHSPLPEPAPPQGVVEAFEELTDLLMN